MTRALYFAFAWTAAADTPADARAFAYHRSLRPILIALIVAVLLETVVVHVAVFFLVNRALAWVLLGFSLLGLIWLLGLVNSVAKLPILVTTDGVRVRAGLIIDLWLPADRIVGVRTGLDFGDLKRPEVLRASLVAYPNVMIELAPPLSVGQGGRRREVTLVALHPDDAPGFAAAVKGLKGEA
ncbi:MAG: hypothetical protein ACXU8S_12495 [Phenylobacterium sp.]